MCGVFVFTVADSPCPPGVPVPRVSSAFCIAEGLAPPWFGLFNALIYMYMKVRAVPSRSEPLPRPWALGFGFGSAPRPRQASRGYGGYCGAHGMVQSPSLPSGSSTYPFSPLPLPGCTTASSPCVARFGGLGGGPRLVGGKPAFCLTSGSPHSPSPAGP